MFKQTSNTILMIEPVAFDFNAETAKNNYFQKRGQQSADEIQTQALQEFTAMVALLRSQKIEVIVIKDTLTPHTPDSIFPNNWISFHEEGLIVFFPMYAHNRRAERRMDIIRPVNNKGFEFTEMNNYTTYEEDGLYLEGTGSMILDRSNRIAYAALSKRTDAALFAEFCRDFKFTPCAFNAYQEVNGERLPIYHTNVMMAVAEQYVVLCSDAIDNAEERQLVIDTITHSGKRIITISEEQLQQFAGNMLQVKNSAGEALLVMSTTAYASLSQEQIAQLESYNKIVRPHIPTIERYGGGSVRCMMAEIFGKQTTTNE